MLSKQPAVRGIRDLEDGAAVDQVLLVRENELRQTRAGSSSCASRSPTDRCCDRPCLGRGRARDGDRAIGEPVRVAGSFERHPRYGAQVTSRARGPGGVDWERLIDGPATPIAELERELDAMIETSKIGISGRS